jgi:hypothetical protein
MKKSLGVCAAAVLAAMGGAPDHSWRDDASFGHTVHGAIPGDDRRARGR